MRKFLLAVLSAALLAGALTGCGPAAPVSSAPPAGEYAPSVTTSAITTTTTAATTSAASATAATTTAKQTTATTRTTAVQTTATTVTTTVTAAPTTTTTTLPDPNRVTVNGKEYAVGDILSYTVMVKTDKPYGTVKIGLRYVQKGLTVPNANMPAQQMSHIMKNIGIGN